MAIISKSNVRHRVVIDSNVLISALVFGGKPRQILELLAKNLITVIIAEEILTEFRRKIHSKFPDFVEDLARLEVLLLRDAIVVKLGLITISVSRDKDDDKFIEAAVVGKCNYIISGDRDLLVLKEYQNIRIVSPAEFLGIAR